MLDKWLVWIHIIGAGLWLGGGFAMAVLAMRAKRSEAPLRYIGDLKRIGPMIGVSASVLILGSGIWLVVRSAEHNFGQAWLNVSIVLFVVIFATGAGFHGSQFRRIGRAIEEHGRESAKTQRLLLTEYLVSWGEVVLLLLVLWFMVHKPL